MTEIEIALTVALVIVCCLVGAAATHNILWR